ncbi:Ty3/gypsy retrotransposon protein [Quillaja saponaria]|uniref:Ty3/gypsy retrotransposon protein n=1 Tax=Quillaja saponaria TaxID=32244 RepID=A0AAD7VEK3_QUISA|nr:Ty3/gypsy retrotransposon protein [Quillaja saponaria]
MEAMDNRFTTSIQELKASAQEAQVRTDLKLQEIMDAVALIQTSVAELRAAQFHPEVIREPILSNPPGIPRAPPEVRKPPPVNIHVPPVHLHMRVEVPEIEIHDYHLLKRVAQVEFPRFEENEEGEELLDLAEFSEDKEKEIAISLVALTEVDWRFIRNFGKISRPLNTLLRKNAFQWDIAAEEAFMTLTNKMTQAPVLALPDYSSSFVIETDASGVGIGAVLLQHGHPLAFISKALGPKHLSLSTYEKELIAIVYAANK